MSRLNAILGFLRGDPKPAQPSNRTVDLRGAVAEAIEGFVTLGRTFSAHDVTVKVRELVNTGTLTIDGKPIEDVDGIRTQAIDHAEVKPLVREYFVQNLERRYEATPNGTYIEYAPIS